MNTRLGFDELYDFFYDRPTALLAGLCLPFGGNNSCWRLVYGWLMTLWIGSFLLLLVYEGFYCVCKSG